MNLPRSCEGCDRPCLGTCHCFDEKKTAMNDSKLLRDMLNNAFSLAGVGV
jgi:endonuclease IV